MDITRWSIPKSDWLYSLELKMEKLYTASKNTTTSWLWLDHEHLIAKFRIKLKKVGKNIRLFKHDLNQIPYDYMVEVTNRFKGLELIYRVSEDLWKEVHDIVQEVVMKTSPEKRNAKRQNSCLKRAYKLLRKEEKWRGKEKRKDILIWMQSSKEQQGEIRKPSSAINAKQ